MSLLDNMRQTLNDVAGNVVEQGKQLTAQTQLQVAVKKMQLERARRIHELGKQTFDWYRNGQLVVSGQVPADVADLCHQLEDLERQLADAQRELDAIAQESAAPEAPHSAPHVDVTPAPDSNPAPPYTTQNAPPPPYPQAPYPPPQYAQQTPHAPQPPQPPYPQPPAPASPYPQPPASPSDPHGTTRLPDQPQPPPHAPYGAPPAAPYGYNPPPANDEEKPNDEAGEGYPGLGPRPPAS